MAIYKGITKSALRALSLMLKATNVDIRNHGTENNPGGPVLYVVNHFTRIETLFLPAVLHDITGKLAYSMADADLFSGTLGTILDRLGAISTRDPRRDLVLTSALLGGDMNVIIFPEGQMVKDKKLIEKGKFAVYNSGIRRAPHTGSARIALNAEFYRKKMARFLATGNREGAVAVARHFDLDLAGIERISRLRTAVVPVNITYFPVRARENAIERFIEKFSGKLSSRFEEELQVEGNMLLDGVDIDINFGAPLFPEDYLLEQRDIRKCIGDDQSYLDREKGAGKIPLVKPGNRMMIDYMKAIYGMTTVNHDHIFSWFIASYPTNSIPVRDLKNRAYLAIRNIESFQLASVHSTLFHDQEYLLTDDHHDRFDDLIAAALRHGIITVSDGAIKRIPERFSALYEFHTLRKDNIIEVMKNEIEPLGPLVSRLIKIMLMSPGRIEKMILKEYLSGDLLIYRKDYAVHHEPGSAGKEAVGRPFFMKKFFKSPGILLIHGYMAAPEEVRPLAEYLHRRGYTVYGVRLSGHGTSPEDLAGKSWKDWYESVNRGYIILKNSCTSVAVAGFSTGAGLALLQAARKNFEFSAVISISAPLRLRGFSQRLVPAVNLWNTFVKKISAGKGAMEFIENHPENPEINYHRNPIAGINQLEQLMKKVFENLPTIMIPALVMQGSDDPVVDPAGAEEILKLIGGAEKKLVTISSKRHGIIRGDTLEETGRQIINFLGDRV